MLCDTYQKPTMETHHQRIISLIPWFQISRHQDIDADGVLINNFVAS